MELPVSRIFVILVSILYIIPVSSVSSVTIGNVGNATHIIYGSGVLLTEVVVPDGKFTVTKINMNLKAGTSPFTEFKIQFYRPVVDKKYELIYEKDVPSKSNYKGLLELSIVPISLTTGDRIGLYNNGPYIPVPHYRKGKTIVFEYRNSPPPAIGDVINFDGVSLSDVGFTLELMAFQENNELLSSTSPPSSYSTTPMLTDLITDSLASLTTADSSGCQDQTTPTVKYCDTTATGCSQLCIDLPGGYQCACSDGFSLAPSDNVTCNDINECNTNNGFCQHNCVNNVGSYTCSCRTGYYVSDDSHSCLDTDECLNSSVCSLQKLCVNTPGTFICLQRIKTKCAGEVGFSTQDNQSLISVPNFIGFFVWLSLLTLIIVILLSVVGSRCGQSSIDSSGYQSETAFCYEGPYNPKEEERRDRERIASQIKKKYPTVSINPPI